MTVASPAIYVVLYIMLMLPTYVLPYFGSNSIAARTLAAAANAAAGGSGSPLQLAFYVHLLCLLGLCVIGYLRGKIVNRTWLLVFPFLALVFDMVPVFTWIPLIPTVMHLLAIILGVASVQAAVAVSAPLSAPSR